MKGRVPAGQYDIKVNVFDSVWALNALSTVTIDIKDIAAEAVLSSGSVRFHGNSTLCLFSLHYLTKFGFLSRKNTLLSPVSIFIMFRPMTRSPEQAKLMA